MLRQSCLPTLCTTLPPLLLPPQATRMFVSNLNQKMSQRFLVLVLLPHVRADIRKNRRLHFALFQVRARVRERQAVLSWRRWRRSCRVCMLGASAVHAPTSIGAALRCAALPCPAPHHPPNSPCTLTPPPVHPPLPAQSLKKATYKAAAFYKGLLLPLCASGTCNLREAVIFTSVIKRTSIPVLHSAAAMLRIAGACGEGRPGMVAVGMSSRLGRQQNANAFHCCWQAPWPTLTAPTTHSTPYHPLVQRCRTAAPTPSSCACCWTRSTRCRTAWWTHW